MSPQDFPQRIRFSWESENSWKGAAAGIHISLFSSRPQLTPYCGRNKGDAGMQGWRWELTRDVDLDGDLGPAHVIFCPAGHILPIQVTSDIDQSQPQGRQILRFLDLERRRDIWRELHQAWGWRQRLVVGWGLELQMERT